MQSIITGGVYAVDLYGTEAYEFKGIHPALIVRMLKEEKMFYVVPLTTYTKERWDKCKRKGFGTRIISTNSIARVDKLNIVSEKQVRGRYYNGGHIVVPTEEEVEAVLRRVEEYLSLTDGKTNKEYKKFTSQRMDFEKDMDILFTEKKFAEFLYPLTVYNDLAFKYPCAKLTHMENADIKDIISRKINCSEVIILKQGNDMDITVKIESKYFLTYAEEYDRFKIQKGSTDR